MGISFYSEWSQLFQSCNWYTFTFIKIEMEREDYLGRVELTLAFVGLCLVVYYTYNKEPMEEINKIADESKNNPDDVTPLSL